MTPTLRPRAARACLKALLAATLMLPACSRAPAQDILGSYFPAWLLCAAIGVVIAVLCRKLLMLVGLGEAVLLPPLTYMALACAATLAVWLAWFGG